MLQVEETRIVKSPGGVEHRGIRWRRAALDEVKMVLISYHVQRNLLMSPNLSLVRPLRTKQNANGQAEMLDTKLKDEGNGKGAAEMKPIVPEVSGETS